MIGKLKFSFLLILSVLLLGCTKSTKEIENRKEDTIKSAKRRISFKRISR